VQSFNFQPTAYTKLGLTVSATGLHGIVCLHDAASQAAADHHLVCCSLCHPVTDGYLQRIGPMSLTDSVQLKFQTSLFFLS